MLQCKEICFENVLAILWDKDGTLADSHQFLRELATVRSRLIAEVVPGIESALLAAFGCQPERYDPAGLMAVGTRLENEVAAAAYIAATGRAWGEALEIAKQTFAQSDRYFSRKAHHTPPFAGISELLKTLRAKGFKGAVLSGDTTGNVQDFLDCYGLTDLVDHWAGSEQEPIKPDPRMVWNACDQLGITPEQTIVIGDSILDQQLARQAQVRAFISVTWGGSPAVPGADITLAMPGQLQVLSD